MHAPTRTLLALLLSSLALPASASPPPATGGMVCEPAVLQVSARDPGNAALDEVNVRFSVTCKGASGTNMLAPEIVFSGKLGPHATPPYRVEATYQVSAMSLSDRTLSREPRLDQLLTGEHLSSTLSAAALPSQFAANLNWDAASGTLSVGTQIAVSAETPVTQWHAYAVKVTDAGIGLTDAGVASTPVVAGAATNDVQFGAGVSRFAGRQAVSATAVLKLSHGTLEVVLGATQAANQAVIQSALMTLDRQPRDLSRAWALAARAQYLGLADEAAYAESKVAAFHPAVLREFQRDLARITPFSPTGR